jgi:uncharacterized protein (TIGR02597 family)
MSRTKSDRPRIQALPPPGKFALKTISFPFFLDAAAQKIENSEPKLFTMHDLLSLARCRQPFGPKIIPVRLRLLLIFCLCLAFGPLQAVNGNPTGFVRITLPNGITRSVSLPLNNMPARTGTVSSVSTTYFVTVNTIPAMQSGEFGPYESKPFVVRFLSGTSAGRYYRISSNNGLGVLALLDLTGPANSLMAVGDKCEIVAVDTLESVFGATAPNLLRNTDPNLADIVFLHSGTAWLNYYNDGTKWLLQGGNGSSQNKVGILPDHGFLFFRRGTTPLELLVMGRVPRNNVVSSIPTAGQTVFLANVFPVDTTLNDLGLHLNPNWTVGANPSAVDNVQMRIPSGWLTFYHDGTSWLRVAGGSTAENPSIPTASSVAILRRGNAFLLERQPPYRTDWH